MYFFVLSLIFTLITGLLGAILTFRSYRKTSITIIVLLVLSLIFSLVSEIQSYHELKSSKLKLEDFKKYSYVSKLGPDGIDVRPNPPLTTTDKLFNLLKSTYDISGEDNHLFYYKCDDVSLTVYKNVIDNYPNFPFSYFALAQCKKQKNQSDWKNYAIKAIEIFKITTQIGGHKSEHDGALNILNNYLNEDR